MLNRLRARPAVTLAVAAGLVLLALSRAATDSSQWKAQVVLALTFAAVYAIAASGLVITYTTTGVFNFAHGAIGMIAAFAYYTLRVQHGVPAPIALIVVLGVFAPLVGLALEVVMRRFEGAPPGTTIVVTIALTVLLIGVATYAYPNTGASRAIPFLFGSRRMSVFGARVSWDELGFILVAVGVALGLRFLLYRARAGVAMRAVVDNRTLAELNGAPSRRIARYSWVLGAFLAALAGVLIAPKQNPLDQITLTFFVLSAYGAAVFGRLRSLPLTFLGAVVLALAQNFSALELHGSGWSRVTLSLPGIFLFAALLLLPEAKLTVGRMVGRRSPATPGLTASLARAAMFVGAVVMVARLAPSARVADITLALVYGVLLLSLVALTGLSGQISLCQYVFLALGAWAMGSVGGGSTFGGLVVAAAVCVPVGLFVALPAIRLQGLYLALVTFGFAVISQTLVFDDPHIFGRHNVAVGRPRLLGLDFAGDRAFLALCGAAFAVVAVGVLAIKRGPIGRRLAAMRDSQAACATLGLDVRRQKLLIFAASAAIAGLAGALYGGQQTTAGGTIQFQPVNNIVLFLFAVVGGITTVSGALIGGALFALLPLLQSQHQQWAGLVFAAIAAAAIGLGRQPNGIAGMVYERLARVGRRAEVTPAPARAPAEIEVTGAAA